MDQRIELQVDDIIDKCDGDLRGAIKILLVLNEQLETDLGQFAQGDGAVGCAGNAGVRSFAQLEPI